MEPPTHHRALALVLTAVLALALARSAPPRAALPGGAPWSPSPGNTSAAGALRRPTAPVPLPRIDPNTASAEELEKLPGIGPALAGRIVAARASGARFDRPQDLLRVRGIGPATTRRLADYVLGSRDGGPPPQRVTDPRSSAVPPSP